MVDKDKLNQYLEMQKQTLSDQEYLDLLFKLLEEDPSKEMLWLLKHDLFMYSLDDRNRLANVLAPYLADPDPIDREKIVHTLFMLASAPGDDAHKILHEFLGEAVTDENKKRILSERLVQLRTGKL